MCGSYSAEGGLVSAKMGSWGREDRPYVWFAAWHAAANMQQADSKCLSERETAECCGAIGTGWQRMCKGQASRHGCRLPLAQASHHVGCCVYKLRVRPRRLVQVGGVKHNGRAAIASSTAACF